MEKVKLPREVAEAIETIRERGIYDNRNYEILEYVVRPPDDTDILYGQSIIINQFATNENFDRLLSALVNGYEVEQSPEDKVREIYDMFESFGVGAEKRELIKQVLDACGHKVEGVNA